MVQGSRLWEGGRRRSGFVALFSAWPWWVLQHSCCTFIWSLLWLLGSSAACSDHSGRNKCSGLQRAHLKLDSTPLLRPTVNSGLHQWHPSLFFFPSSHLPQFSNLHMFHVQISQKCLCIQQKIFCWIIAFSLVVASRVKIKEISHTAYFWHHSSSYFF